MFGSNYPTDMSFSHVMVFSNKQVRFKINADLNT